MCTDDFADCVVHRLFAGDPRSSTGGHHSDHPGNSREKGPWYVVGTQGMRCYMLTDDAQRLVR